MFTTNGQSAELPQLAVAKSDFPIPAHWQGTAQRHIGELHYWLPWIGALLFATVLTCLPLEGFKDRQEYLNFFTNSPIILLANLQNGPLSLLTNEPLFLLLCLGLGQLVGPENGLRFIIFSGAFLVALQTFKVAPKSIFLLLAFLLVPQVIEKHIVHLRQGLALGVFLLGWMSTRPRLRWAIMLVAPLLHSSFFFVLMLTGVAIASRRFRLSKMFVVLLYVAIAITVGLVLGVITGALGARQAEEETFGAAAQGISGFGFVFWTLPLAIMLLEGRQFFREHILEVGSLIFYLASYFISPFSARVFESSLLLILLSSLRMKRFNRNLFVATIFAYMLMQWFMIAYGLTPAFT